MKAYLGDAVYIDISEYDEILLFLDNGYGPTNQIVMDGSVLSNFEDYIANLRKEKMDGKDA